VAYLTQLTGLSSLLGLGASGEAVKSIYRVFHYRVFHSVLRQNMMFTPHPTRVAYPEEVDRDAD
jgi:hypothetical protein